MFCVKRGLILLVLVAAVHAESVRGVLRARDVFHIA